MENIVEWKDKELVIRDAQLSHANGGRLEKLWAEDTKSGRIFLIKAGSLFGYEPFSEKIAYIVGKHIGLDVLEYDILPVSMFKSINLQSYCKYVSICEKIDRKNFSITSIAEIKRAQNAIKEDYENSITNREIMYDILPRKYIDSMFLFDAIIGNVDRHYGNVHLLRGKDGDIIGAPILDNGNSLLAQVPTLLILAAGDNVGEKFNKACTTKKTHDDQIRSTETLSGITFNISSTTINILNEIEPILELMPKARALAIKKYLVYRLHKYLGYMKNPSRLRNTSEYKNNNKEEKEFT